MPSLTLSATTDQYKRLNDACLAIHGIPIKQQLIIYCKQLVRTHETQLAEQAARDAMLPEVEVT